MIPNLKMGYYHQKEYFVRPYNINEKMGKKPLKDTMEEGFEYSSLLTSKTYSILSYIVGGFVGSKSQINNNKHNLSYDLSGAIINLLNPCKYEREKTFKKCSDTLYSTASKISPETYNKYIVRSSQKEKMVDLGLEWLENYMFGFEEFSNQPQLQMSCNCDENVSSDKQGFSTDVVDKAVNHCNESTENKNLVNNLGIERFRKQSECSVESTDSESFIVFNSVDQDDESGDCYSDDIDIEKNCWKLENFNFDSEEDSDDNDSDEDCEFESVDKELADANDKWKRNYEDVSPLDDNNGARKVRFSDNVKINNIVAWDFAYRAARAGPWEQMARDRVRFQERILRLSPTISPILKKEHRDKIYKELYS